MVADKLSFTNTLAFYIVTAPPSSGFICAGPSRVLALTRPRPRLQESAAATRPS
jgi:hypothetical protein